MQLLLPLYGVFLLPLRDQTPVRQHKIAILTLIRLSLAGVKASWFYQAAGGYYLSKEACLAGCTMNRGVFVRGPAQTTACLLKRGKLD
ncbi:MAG TPA: hypothetical protein DER02_03445 [Gammaproteobacteria bacterium]|nr:hypothetical protein [Gammaproteobacteria bacterium]|tara:strand:+ start:349 stop:612 length:264 start_codon:yes stop_codon:yes gene_type:complete